MGKTHFLLGCLAAVALVGCTGESSRPMATGKGTIRALNAIKTSPTISLLIEERRIGNVDYKFSSNFASYDDLEYIFNVETVLAGDLMATRIASQPLDVVKDTEYTFLISGALAAPDITVWELPRRDWDGSETVFEIRVANTSDSLGDVDVYIAAPGIPPMPGNAVGTLSFGEVLPVMNYEAGGYSVIFTAPGDPSIVHFESNEFGALAQNSVLICIFDGDANDTFQWSVRGYFANGSSGVLNDVDSTGTARFYHASTALATADIYNDETLMAPPIVTDHAFGAFTDDMVLPVGVNLLFYTATGMSGVPLLDSDVTIFDSAHKYVYAVGDVDTLQAIEFIPDRRSVETSAKLSVLNSSINHPLVDLFIVPTGTDFTVVIPGFANLAIGSIPRTSTIVEGSFEMYITPAAELTILTGPITLDTMFGDVFEFIIYDNVDPMIVDLASIPLP